MEITFNPAKDIVIVSEIKRPVDKISVREISDSPERKLVVAMTLELGSIILWQGDAYDAVGQWTDTDVINRITELYS